MYLKHYSAEMDSSQVDIMATQMPYSQDRRLRASTHEYTDIILFKWKPEVHEPFQIYNKDQFSNTEILEEWLLYQMVPSSRCRQLKPFEKFPGEVFSMFGKVEKDTSNTRKMDILKALNVEFRGFIRNNMAYKEAYKALVESNPYRVLAFNSYDRYETPLDTNFTNSQPPLTDVCLKFIKV